MDFLISGKLTDRLETHIVLWLENTGKICFCIIWDLYHIQMILIYSISLFSINHYCNIIL